MLAGDVNKIYLLSLPYSFYQYSGGAPTEESGWSVCTAWCLYYPQGVKCVHLLQLYLPSVASPFHFTFTLHTDSARMGFKPHRTYPEFHVHIKRLGSWVAEGRWTLADKRSGIVGCWGSWIGFPDLGSFYGVQWFHFPSVTLYSKKFWGYTVSSELLLTVFLWMGVCMDLHIHTHLLKWLITGIGRRAWPVASIN